MGILYGVGVGPGDPSLLTLKAVDIIGKCEIVAAPDTGGRENLALNIIKDYLEDKEILLVEAPMTRDEEKLRAAQSRTADLLCRKLKAGFDICFVTIGDPSIYSTYTYVHRLVIARGFEARLIPGVPSFCAVAAALNIPLCEGGEALHIIPASYGETDLGLSLTGTKVLMKSGAQLKNVVDILKEKNLLEKAGMVSRCSMPDEKIFKDISAINFDESYFSTIVVKE